MINRYSRIGASVGKEIECVAIVQKPKGGVHLDICSVKAGAIVIRDGQQEVDGGGYGECTMDGDDGDDGVVNADNSREDGVRGRCEREIRAFPFDSDSSNIALTTITVMFSKCFHLSNANSSLTIELNNANEENGKVQAKVEEFRNQLIEKDDQAIKAAENLQSILI